METVKEKHNTNLQKMNKSSKGLISSEILTAFEFILVAAFFITLLSICGISFIDVINAASGSITSIKDFVLNLL